MQRIARQVAVVLDDLDLAQLVGEDQQDVLDGGVDVDAVGPLRVGPGVDLEAADQRGDALAAVLDVAQGGADLAAVLDLARAVRRGRCRGRVCASFWKSSTERMPAASRRPAGGPAAECLLPGRLGAAFVAGRERGAFPGERSVRRRRGRAPVRRLEQGPDVLEQVAGGVLDRGRPGC